MKQITSLTSEQESEIPKFISKWVNKASEPTDRTKATKAVHTIYKQMGESQPIVIFGESPLSTIFFSLMVKDDNQLYNKLRNHLGNHLDDQLYNKLRNHLGTHLYIKLRNHLYFQLRTQLYTQLRTQLDTQLYSQLGNQLRSQLKDINKHWYLTTFWLAWAGWYDYGQYIGVEFDKTIFDMFMAFVTNVGFIIPYKNIAFVSEAPIKVIWDNAGRLHYEHGKAVEYKDGWGLNSLDGVSFTEDEFNKIVNEEFTLETIGQANMGADKSAIAQKYLRPDRLLESTGAVLIHKGQPRYANDNITRLWFIANKKEVPQTGKLPKKYHEEYADKHRTLLYKVDNFMGTGETQFCMRMEHPTIGRTYIEWVPPEVGSKGDADFCQASAWKNKQGSHISIEDWLLSINA